MRMFWIDCFEFLTNFEKISLRFWWWLNNKLVEGLLWSLISWNYRSETRCSCEWTIFNIFVEIFRPSRWILLKTKWWNNLSALWKRMKFSWISSLKWNPYWFCCCSIRSNISWINKTPEIISIICSI